MPFSDLTENPPETALLTAVLGLVLSQGLTTTEQNVLGRLIIYFGEALVTVSVLQAAHEAEEALAAHNAKTMTVSENDEATISPDNLLALIKQLQQENQSLQEQIWVLQEKVSIP